MSYDNEEVHEEALMDAILDLIVTIKKFLRDNKEAAEYTQKKLEKEQDNCHVG